MSKLSLPCEPSINQNRCSHYNTFFSITSYYKTLVTTLPYLTLVIFGSQTYKGHSFYATILFRQLYPKQRERIITKKINDAQSFSLEHFLLIPKQSLHTYHAFHVILDTIWVGSPNYVLRKDEMWV